MRLSLGFSPCPNDTFIFDALIHHKIDTEGLEFDVIFEDVEALNLMAQNQELDITKLSYFALAFMQNNYQLLDSGSALGFGVGPMLITKNEALAAQIQAGLVNNWENLKVGIPGKLTTANFLLDLSFPDLKAENKVEFVFSEIEDALLNNSIDLGLIIHENRFTYQEKGLYLVRDLGAFWEELTRKPIPLGGIVVKKDLPYELKQKINRVLNRSVEFAFANPQSSLEFIRQHAQSMEEEVIFKHIDLYVNEFSIDLGDEGKQAISAMYQKAQDLNMIPMIEDQNLFLNPLIQED